MLQQTRAVVKQRPGTAPWLQRWQRQQKNQAVWQQQGSSSPCHQSPSAQRHPQSCLLLQKGCLKPASPQVALCALQACSPALPCACSSVRCCARAAEVPDAARQFLQAVSPDRLLQAASPKGLHQVATAVASPCHHCVSSSRQDCRSMSCKTFLKSELPSPMSSPGSRCCRLCPGAGRLARPRQSAHRAEARISFHR